MLWSDFCNCATCPWQYLDSNSASNHADTVVCKVSDNWSAMNNISNLSLCNLSNAATNFSDVIVVSATGSSPEVSYVVIFTTFLRISSLALSLAILVSSSLIFKFSIDLIPSFGILHKYQLNYMTINIYVYNFLIHYLILHKNFLCTHFLYLKK